MSRDPFDQALIEAMPKLKAACRGLAKDATRAEDLMQDALLNAIRARDSFQIGTNMGAWVCFIARNCFYTERRRAWRNVQMAEGQAEAVVAPGNAFDKVHLAEVLAALSFLPEEQAEAIMLIGEGEDYETVAQMLGAEVGTIKSRVSRGRAALELYFSNVA